MGAGTIGLQSLLLVTYARHAASCEQLVLQVTYARHAASCEQLVLQVTYARHAASCEQQSCRLPMPGMQLVVNS